MADNGGDEGSNFYNTPLSGATPLQPTQIPNASEIARPATPEQPHPQIPGLSLCNAPTMEDIQSHPESEQPVEGYTALDANPDTSKPVITANSAASNGESALPSDRVTGTVEVSKDTELEQPAEGSDSGADFLGPVIMAITAAAKEEFATTSDRVDGTPQDLEDTRMGGTDLDGTVVENKKDINKPESNETQGQDTTMLVAQSMVSEGASLVTNEVLMDEVEPQENEQKEWETDSSPYESSSDSSSDSSDSSDDEEDDYELLDPEEQARILMAAAGSDDEDGKDEKGGAKEVRTANEKSETIIPKPDITVTADTKVEMLGNVDSIVGNIALIKANISGEYQVLESGSVLCLANLEVIGVVSDTFGKVEQPFYTVHFTNPEELQKAGVEKGAPVFYVVDHSTFVFTQPLKGLKGSDASNLHDEEVGADEVEFSDDEAEAEYKRQLKMKRQQKRDGRPESGRGGKRRGAPPPGPSGLRQHTELNYDDEPQEDGYKTLQRPKDLHEQMMTRDMPMEERSYQPPERSFRGGRARGRGRGHDRGRGGRGRDGGGRYQPPQDRHQQQPYPPRFQEQAPNHRQPSNESHPPQQSSYTPNTASYAPPQQTQPVSQSFPMIPPQVSQFSFPNFPFSPQQSPLPFPPPGSHINPAFLAAFLQQQQQHQQPRQGQQQPQQPQQQQYQQPHQQQYHQPHLQSAQSMPQPSPAPQGSADTFAAVQAQLDLLRRLSGGGGS